TGRAGAGSMRAAQCGARPALADATLLALPYATQASLESDLRRCQPPIALARTLRGEPRSSAPSTMARRTSGRTGIAGGEQAHRGDREGMRVMRANLDGSHVETLVEREPTRLAKRAIEIVRGSS